MAYRPTALSSRPPQRFLRVGAGILLLCAAALVSGCSASIIADHLPTETVRTAPADPDLSLIAERWLFLPPAVRAGIVAMVRASGDGDGL